ncbi:hypothetical protein BpHYR1_042957 [Brachionus plicatilis]|uniref:Reverse transcriptase/retrotransposon-derived protein RNase H-like domain-containing protein n=1 Tax=Brachionus plicatilis TaxID=10195 RepID=A0A3M7SRN6_BRAPC|nr:hypothetical protein BpHYR1_042957 [Brachionus plicatilis]
MKRKKFKKTCIKVRNKNSQQVKNKSKYKPSYIQVTPPCAFLDFGWHVRFSGIQKLNSVNSRKSPNRITPVTGEAIFNNTIVNYLCDSGADWTIIDSKTFNPIKRHAPKTKLKIQSGRQLFSCTGPIKFLEREEILKNVEILVTETVSNNACLLGKNLTNRNDEVDKIIDHDSSTYSIFKNNSHNREEEVSNQSVNQTFIETLMETEVVAEFKDMCRSKNDINMETVSIGKIINGFKHCPEKPSEKKKAGEHFEKLKGVLSSELVLAQTGFERPMILTTDACDYSYGAVFGQEFDDSHRFYG